jgi:hypothetical protein
VASLREDIFRQAFHAVTAVSFLDGLKNQPEHYGICSGMGRMEPQQGA